MTFQQNLADWGQVKVEVAKIAAMVSEDVAAEGRPAARIVVKVRYAAKGATESGQGYGYKVKPVALDPLRVFTHVEDWRLEKD